MNRDDEQPWPDEPWCDLCEQAGHTARTCPRRDDDVGPFDDKRGMARNDHPDTSQDAADKVLPRSGTQRRRVYDCLKLRGPHGATDLDQQRILRMEGNTQRPRRVELVRDGWVKDSGQRRRQQGRDMIVWVAT